MNTNPFGKTLRLLKPLGVILLSSTTVFTSGNAVANSSTYAATPPSITSGSANTDPLVMLAMSNDHQLFVKAYTDYTDLDGDGTIDTTYTDTFDYYGYFDSNRCYNHTSGRFQPTTVASGTNNHDCGNADWSGNFLNWATMTRMDVLRKVLFGGKRSTDTSGVSAQTTLERAMLPTDVHAFVKTFAVSNTIMRRYTPYNTNQISLCNVTQGSGASESATQPPLLRVASGLWPGWSSNERAQCLYRDEFNSGNGGGLGIEPPSSTSDSLDNLEVRVDACVTGKLEENCKQYPTGEQKPTGLLQKFGERASSPIRFGLMTGSYSRNMSGGVLRKDISKVTDNTTSSLDEINSSTGQFINQTSSNHGIINAISHFRISRYNFDAPFTYNDCNSPGILNISEGNASTGCSAWGNPIGEVYLESLRYFAGQTSATGAFYNDDSGYLPGAMPAPLSTWTDPMDNSNYCANCSVVVISTGLNSFDTDQMGSASNIPGLSGAADVNTATNTVGNSTNENINGNNYFIGESGAATNQQCTSKTVANFSDAKGICPEMPTLKGGYQIAGLAHHAQITDLRTDNVTFPDTQKVDTYAISLAESLPSFSIPVDGNTVTFSPHCEANSSGGAAISDSGWRICSLADVTIESLAADQSTGSMLFHWEDSTWGFDYDMDGVERITWCVGSACSPSISNNQIKFTASSELTAAGHAMLFGYTVSGTSSNGVKRHVLRPGGQNFNVLYSPFTNSGNQPADVSTTYTASGSAGALFENPLWYAAKYGSFNDLNGNDRPDQQVEWDSKINQTGAAGSDGIPDNFFQVSNPGLLETQLSKIFNSILERTSAGSALAILSTNSDGNGAVYQALYDPLHQVGTKSITWGGRVHALFVDEKGHLREDSDSAGTKGQLDDYNTDKIVQLFYSEGFGRTLVQRHATADGGDTTSPDGSPVELTALQPIWDARDELAKLDASALNLQRIYDTAVSTTGAGRHILTWIDSNTNGIIDGGEFTNFLDSSFATDFGLLNVSTSTEANNIINYIRGQEISDYRSRTVDFDLDGTDEVWRLGDIIHSTPAVIAAPDAPYYTKYNDPTYQTFSSQYSERREVLYVGANDGMLHAFNGGFFNKAAKQFRTTNSTSTATAHPLGAELWAYVPFNLLPHLKWLTETNYPHVYYMDGPPRIYDVNIFTPDSDHPGGWGTILVAGMRFGGGELSYDHDNNAGTADLTTRSAYVVLDVTNPEIAPKLLAEITNPNLGFTSSTPALAVNRVPGAGGDWANPSVNNWYLVFGSGPTELDSATSTQDARMFVYNLGTNAFETVSPPTMSANSFVGDPTAVDWNNDFIDDVVYFGTVSGTEAAPTGSLNRLLLNTFETNTLLDPAQPFSAPPVTGVEGGALWIYTGTGRLFTTGDNGNTTQQTYYGIKDASPYNATLTLSSLQNVTGVQVFADGSINDSLGVLPTLPDNTYTELRSEITGQSGWYKHLDFNGTDPSMRNINRALIFSQLVLFSAYTPPVANVCVAEGISNLFAVDFATGTASPGIGLGADPAGTTNADGSSLTIDNVVLGRGVASEPTLRSGSGGTDAEGRATASVDQQMGTGAITNTSITGGGSPTSALPSTSGRTSWREIFELP